MTLVIDLSHWNVIPESLQGAWDYGVRGLIHKSTEGTGFTDSKVKARYSMVYGTPMLWGVYHFLRPGSVKDQVDYFLNQSTSFMEDSTLFACDYEDPNVSLQEVLEFMQYLEQQIATVPILYSGHVLKEKMAVKPVEELTKYRLWLAQYAAEPVLPVGWGKYFLWQYTDKAAIPGIDPPTDVNTYEGSEEQLREEWTSAKETVTMSYDDNTSQPTPKPAPADTTTEAAEVDAASWVVDPNAVPSNVDQLKETFERQMAEYVEVPAFKSAFSADDERYPEAFKQAIEKPVVLPELIHPTVPVVTKRTQEEMEAGKKRVSAAESAQRDEGMFKEIAEREAKQVREAKGVPGVGEQVEAKYKEAVRRMQTWGSGEERERLTIEHPLRVYKVELPPSLAPENREEVR